MAVAAQNDNGSVSYRRTLFAGALVAISLFGDSYLYAVLPVRYEEAGVGLVAVGWLLSANRWIRFLTNPLAGEVGTRLGWGWAFAAALWLAAFTTGGYGLFKGLALLVLMRALWGLCWSFLRLGGMAAVIADSPMGSRGRLMGLFNGTFRIGSVIGVVAGGWLADRIGFAQTALVFGAATAVGAVIASFPGAVSGRWGAPARNPSTQPTKASLREIWLPAGREQLAACLSISALQFIVSGLITGTAGYLVKARLGADVSIGSWVIGASTFTGLLLGSRFALDLAVGPFVGHWADRRGRTATLGVTTTVLLMGLAGLAWAGSAWLIILILMLSFAAGTGTAAVLDGWAGDLAGKTPGRFLAVYNTWLDVGAAAGPLFGYYLAACAGLTATYLAGAVLLAVAWGARVWIGRR